MSLKHSMLLSLFAKQTDRNAMGVAYAFRMVLVSRSRRRSDWERTSATIAPRSSGGRDTMVVVSRDARPDFRCLLNCPPSRPGLAQSSFWGFAGALSETMSQSSLLPTLSQLSGPCRAHREKTYSEPSVSTSSVFHGFPPHLVYRIDLIIDQALWCTVTYLHCLRFWNVRSTAIFNASIARACCGRRFTALGFACA
jgi:hypothetical protein